ncbi:MAG: hypothetical protein PF961_04115 [Planctomycetota bacterium]|nr:hypothetical protein [Planctomycetota bacterium]
MANLWTILKERLHDQLSHLNLEIMAATVDDDRLRTRKLRNQREAIREALAARDTRRATTLCM